MSKQSVEIIVHIDETLSKANLDELESSLCENYGIESVHVNPTRQHLMRVDYLPDSVNTTQVLEYVTNKGVHAELIGGI